MTKYHINKDGIPRKCRAEKRNCPYGDSQHYDSFFEAQEAADIQNLEALRKERGEKTKRKIKYPKFSNYEYQPNHTFNEPKSTNSKDKQYPRLVSWEYYDASYMPRDKEQLTEIYLMSPAGEAMLESGKVPISGGFFLNGSPYFRIKKTIGRTRSAKTYGQLKDKCLERYPDSRGAIEFTAEPFVDAGEYMFMSLPESLIFSANPINDENWYGTNYVKKEFFNEDLMKKIINYEPIDKDTGEVIEKYQTEDLPQFLKDLSEYDKELYQKSVKGTAWEGKSL